MAIFSFRAEGTEDVIFEVERPYVPVMDDVIHLNGTAYKVESVVLYLEAEDDYNPQTGRTKPFNLSLDVYRVYVSVVP